MEIAENEEIFLSDETLASKLNKFTPGSIDKELHLLLDEKNIYKINIDGKDTYSISFKGVERYKELLNS